MQPEDPRPVELREEMAIHFHDCEAEYRDGDWCEIVYEDNERVVIADKTSTGNEVNTWADHSMVPSARELVQMMHTVASRHTDHRFGATYPVVFDKKI